MSGKALEGMREIKESKGQSTWKKEVRPSEARGCKRDSLVVQGLRLPPSAAGGTGSVLAWGSEIPHAKTKAKTRKD